MTTPAEHSTRADSAEQATPAASGMESALAAPAQSTPVSAVESASDGGIATIARPVATTAKGYPIDPGTRQPKRPLAATLASVAFFASAIGIGATGFWVIGTAYTNYAEASWLMAVGEAHKPGWVQNLDATYPPAWAGWQILVTLVTTLAGVIGAAVTGIIGYYAYHGYGWTRTGGLVALGASLLGLLLRPVPGIAWIVAAAVGAALLWSPKVRAFFAAWQDRRHPVMTQVSSRGPVFYGPLPRFQKM